jgi:DNA-binding XRE family transcriptional regulator
MSRTRDDALINAFAVVLRKARQETGLTQEELAWAAGVDRTFIGLLENGKRQPSLSVICALAYCIGHTPESLVAAAHQLSLKKVKVP